MSVHHALCMQHDFVKLVEFLLLKQEQHIVLQNERIAGGDVDSLFESSLGKIDVVCFFERECQVAKGFFIVAFDLKGVEEADCRIFVIVMFELQGSQVHDRSKVSRVDFMSALKHFLSLDT